MKNHKNAKSQKTKGFEQSYLDARFAALEGNLIAPPICLKIQDRLELFMSNFFEKKK